MIEQHNWAFAAVTLGSGLLLGELAGRMLRNWMGRPARASSVREMAASAGTFVFWSGAAVGTLVAAGLTSNEALDQISTRASRLIPDALLATLILIIGYAVALGFSTAVGQSVARASGVRQRGLERAIRWTVFGTAMAFALGQLGVDTTMLMIALAALAGAPALAAAALTALGARDVAANIAAGRALRSQLAVGDHLRCCDTEGTIVAIHPVTVEVETLLGETVQIPLRRLMNDVFATTPAPSRQRSTRHSA
jgi:small-conductance mechanosensitive channel